MRLPLLAALPTLLALLPQAAPATQGEELWEISSRLEDRVSRYATPPSTRRQCLRPAATAEDLLPMEQGCRVIEQRTDGTRVSFSFECVGRQRMIGRGEFDRPEAGRYSGSLEMRGSADGQPIDLAMSYAGRRIGSCPAGTGTAPAGR